MTSSQRFDYEFVRIMECAKPAIATVIIYAIAFYMGWEKPYWATVSAASVNLLSQGMTLYRGVIRMAGTFVGGFTGLVLIALFPQERWAYMIAAILPLMLFGYGCTGKNDYFYVVCGITFMVVMGVTWTIDDWSSGESHQIVMLRLSQTLMGSLVMVLVSVLIWPKTSIREFEDLARKGWANQLQLYDAVRKTMSGEDRGDEARRLRLNDIDMMEEIHFVLHIAENDSFEMMETGHHWHEFLHQSAVQVEGLESLRESLADVQGLELRTVLPDLDTLLSELAERFEQTQQMLAKKAPTRMPQTVALTVDEAEIEALPRFQQAAVAAIRHQLENLEALSRSIFDCVAEIRMFAQPKAEHAGHDGHDAHGGHASHGFTLALDPDRFRGALGIVFSIWIGFLCWIYIWDVPNGPIFWAMCGVLAFVITYRGEVPFTTLLWSWAIGTFAAVICYVFIMQHLDGFREFGAMVFIALFLMGYIFYPLAHPAARMFTLISFTIVLSADNQQHYSLEHALHYVLWIWLTLSIPIVGKACFIPVRPDKMCLRLLDRFFRQSYLLISAHGPEGGRRLGVFERLQMIFLRNDLTDYPRKMALYSSDYDSFKLIPEAGTVDLKELGTPPAKAQDLLMSLFLLAYRVKDVVAARELPRMDVVEQAFMDEKLEWHQLIEEWFRRQAGGPGQAMEPATDLLARLARLESRIDETFARVDKGAFSALDSENFYRLLSSYRGLSEAVINHARVAETFDWPRWRETRF